MRQSLFIRHAWILFVLASMAATAQQLITGKVIDPSKSPVPFAHVLIAKSNRGTVANAQGEFQLYLQSADRELLVTSIGYKSASVLLDIAQSRYVITLPEDLVLLNEFVVTPRDYATELVKSAIQNIPQNYPQSAELISGFLRERFSKDSLGKEFYHVVESQLEVLKESYRNKHERGLVRLKKSINVTESEVNQDLKIYAGGHLAHRFDFVMKRDDFLDSARMKKYRYEIEDTLRYDGHELIKVSYVKNDSSEFGHVFIKLPELAFVKIEHVQDSDRAGNLFDSDKRVYLKVTTEYFQSNGLWRIGYVNYETKFITKSAFYLNSIFSTHDFVSATGDIPYHERLHFGQYMLEATKSADTVDWVGVNRTLAETGDQQVATSKKNRGFDFSRLELGLSFYHTSYSVDAHNVLLQNNSINFNTPVSEGQGVSQGLQLTIAYRIRNRWGLHFSTLGSFSGAHLRDFGFGASYRQRLGARSRFFIEPQIGFQITQFSVEAGLATLQKDFSLNRVKLNSPTVNVFSGTKSNNVTAGLSVQYELSFRWSVQLGFTYFMQVKSSNGVVLMEDNNALTNQRVFVKDGSEGLTISANSNVMNLNYYIFSGFVYRI